MARITLTLGSLLSTGRVVRTTVKVAQAFPFSSRVFSPTCNTVNSDYPYFAFSLTRPAKARDVGPSSNEIARPRPMNARERDEKVVMTMHAQTRGDCWSWRVANLRYGRRFPYASTDECSTGKDDSLPLIP